MTYLSLEDVAADMLKMNDIIIDLRRRNLELYREIEALKAYNIEQEKKKEAEKSVPPVEKSVHQEIVGNRDSSKIKEGMTSDEVAKILGLPLSRVPLNNINKFLFNYKNSISVIFYNNKTVYKVL